MTRLLSLVDPDGQERLAGGALGADRGSGELDLLVGHALDGDLAGGAAADRGDDDQAVRADRERAVAGGLAPGPGLALLWSAVKASFQSSWSCPWRNRSGSGSTSRTRPLVLVGLADSAAISARLTWLPLIEPARRSASSTAAAKGSASSSSSRGLSTRRSSESSSWATSGAGTSGSAPGRARRPRRGRGGPGRRGSPTPPRCGSGSAGASARARSGDRRPRARGPSWPGRDGPAGGVAEHRGAETRLVPPDLGHPVPPLDQHVVDLGAGRGDLVEVVQPLGHQPGVEHSLGVDHVLLGVGLAWPMALRVWRNTLRWAGLSRQARYLATTTGESTGADLDPLVQERGRVARWPPRSEPASMA